MDAVDTTRNWNSVSFPAYLKTSYPTLSDEKIKEISDHFFPATTATEGGAGSAEPSITIGGNTYTEKDAVRLGFDEILKNNPELYKGCKTALEAFDRWLGMITKNDTEKNNLAYNFKVILSNDNYADEANLLLNYLDKDQSAELISWLASNTHALDEIGKIVNKDFLQFIFDGVKNNSPTLNNPELRARLLTVLDAMHEVTPDLNIDKARILVNRFDSSRSRNAQTDLALGNTLRSLTDPSMSEAEAKKNYKDAEEFLGIDDEVMSAIESDTQTRIDNMSPEELEANEEQIKKQQSISKRDAKIFNDLGWNKSAEASGKLLEACDRAIESIAAYRTDRLNAERAAAGLAPDTPYLAYAQRPGTLEGGGQSPNTNTRTAGRPDERSERERLDAELADAKAAEEKSEERHEAAKKEFNKHIESVTESRRAEIAELERRLESGQAAADAAEAGLTAAAEAIAEPGERAAFLKNTADIINLLRTDANEARDELTRTIKGISREIELNAPPETRATDAPQAEAAGHQEKATATAEAPRQARTRTADAPQAQAAGYQEKAATTAPQPQAIEHQEKATTAAPQPQAAGHQEKATTVETPEAPPQLTAEEQGAVIAAASIGTAYSSALDRVIANGFIPSISRYVDVAIQTLKTLSRIIEDDERAGRATEQHIIQLHAEFTEAVMSLPEKLTRGEMELWEYLTLTAQLETMPPPPSPKDDPDGLRTYTQDKQHLSEQAAASKERLATYKTDIMRTFWEGLTAGLEPELQGNLTDRLAEVEAKNGEKIKRQIAGITNIAQLAKMLKAPTGSLPPGARQEMLKQLSKLLEGMGNNVKPSDKGALEEIKNNPSIPQALRDKAAALLEQLDERAA
ncbi:hypothetical protein NO2_0686 [Candidatus Termititenax persephonae]|uniref:Uncharacterized protein n=1 Tax=Candidatus Termititenax persephonae TaxID=2218525 RepID=A0A388TIB1_9BACT|nr:hypothetical protein NO2_0686 [Candidatus Termititenax persephonae]